MSDLLSRGDVVTFDVFAILGTKYKSVKVLSILDYSTAKLFVDVEALHRNVYPTLPINIVPDDPKQYYYAKLELNNGNIDVIGLPWIKSETVLVHSTQTMTLTFVNITPSDQSRLIQIVQANGFNPNAVTVI